MQFCSQGFCGTCAHGRWSMQQGHEVAVNLQQWSQRVWEITPKPSSQGYNFFFRPQEGKEPVIVEQNGSEPAFTYHGHSDYSMRETCFQLQWSP